MRNRKILKTYLYLIAVVLLLGVQSAAVCSKDWPQPLGPITKEQVIKECFEGKKLSPVEGIWVDEDDLMEIAIIKNKYPIYKDYDYIGIVIVSRNMGNFIPGDLILVMKTSADYKANPGSWFSRKENGRCGTTFLMVSPSIMYFRTFYSEYFKSGNDLDEYWNFIRVYPKEGEEGSKSPGSVFSGTGFFIANDLVLTNWHVVEGCSDIKVTLSTGKEAKAEVAVKDTVNDLALLRVKGLESAPAPLALGVPRTVKAGDKAYTIGFPLPDEMGVQAKVSEGIINSTSGMEDDPRMFQISIPVQPGNSGGPLLNSKGEVIGVVTAGLNNIYLLVKKETLSQNVNYAMKINYLDTLLGMLPEAPKLAESVDNGEMEASQIMEKLRPGVVLVTAKGGEEKEKPEEK